jgi:hypothetical protein
MLPIYFISYIFIYLLLEFNYGINQIEKTMKEKKKRKRGSDLHVWPIIKDLMRACA